jgi:methyl-accepting chemotaxis protein
MLGKTRFRVTGRSFGGGRLIVAVPTDRVGGLTTEAARLNVILLVAILALVGIGTALVMRGLTGPIHVLERAAALLAQGQLEGSAATLRALASRGDEIGELANCYAAASERLAALIAASVEVSDNLAPVMTDLEKLTGALAEAAGRQNERSQDLSNTFDLLDTSLENVADKLAEAYSGAQQLTFDLSTLDSIAKRMRKHTGDAGILLVAGNVTGAVEGDASRLPDGLADRLAQIAKHIDEQATQLVAVDGKALAMVQRLSDAMQAQAKSKHRRAVAARAIEDGQLVADKRREQVGRLHKSAAALRTGLRRLDSILATLR